MARKAQPVEILPPPSSSDDETQDQEGSSSSTDDEQPQHHAPQPQKPQESDDSDDETEDDEPGSQPEPVAKKPSLQEAQESDDSDTDSDETQNSPSASAFTIKPSVPKAVAKSPEPKTPSSKPPRVKSRAKRPAESEETDNASKSVLKIQETGKGKGGKGNAKRPAESEVEKIDKVSKSKKSKVTDGVEQNVGTVDKVSKGKKVVSGDEEGVEVEEKKSLVKWHWKDEIALLGGIVDYEAETGDDWKSKLDVFYEFVKDLLSVNLTKNQLSEKIKRLKTKFQTNVGKCQNGGEEPVFSKPHEKKLFELSQKIWGSEGTGTERNDSKVKSTKKNGKKDGIVVGNASTSTPARSSANRQLFVREEVKETIVEDRKEETQDFWSLYPRLCASLESEASGYLPVMAGNTKEYVKEIISGIGEEKARDLEDEWKAIQMMDHQLYAKRAKLISKQAEAVLDSFDTQS